MQPKKTEKISFRVDQKSQRRYEKLAAILKTPLSDLIRKLLDDKDDEVKRENKNAK